VCLECVCGVYISIYSVHCVCVHVCVVYCACIFIVCDHE